jgi:2-polyprenyl-3-methyl-5-hydroxy-6-metoxy-1,4-benzoquinol methylase
VNEGKLARARSAAWADLPTSEIDALIAESRRIGWREALAAVEARAPFFAKRMRNLSLTNWHVLLGHSTQSAALDVGTGFGSNVLGLASYYRKVVGVDFLPDRTAYAALRAQQLQAHNCHVLRADGHSLPFVPGSFSLVTLNGVLEWAALYHDERRPRDSQLGMLRQVRPLLAPGGTVAVAIENRFALENLLGLPDTHTDLHLVPALPRWIAGLYSRARKGEPYRTYLYGRTGYRKLLAAAGFESVGVFDLVASYNDYDFVVDPADVASYRLLYGSGAVRHFYAAAGRARDWLGRAHPSWLAGLAYAYLVIGGESVSTALDPSHEVWKAAGVFGLDPGRHRFGCCGRAVGTMAVVAHDGRSLRCLLEIAPPGAGEPLGGAILPGSLGRRWSTGFRHVGSAVVNGAQIHAHVARS